MYKSVMIRMRIENKNKYNVYNIEYLRVMWDNI